MLLIIVIIVVILIVLYKNGAFKKKESCRCCGKILKGNEQKLFGDKDKFILCKSCAERIHPQIMRYAGYNWSYSDYLDYLAWDEETKEERSRFNPDYRYGYNTKLLIDAERGLFCLSKNDYKDLVLRFADLKDYDLNFTPFEMEKKLLNTSVRGSEFVAVELLRPAVYFEEVVYSQVCLSVKKKGLLSDEYEYKLSDDFIKVIRVFTVCYYMEEEKHQTSAKEQRVGNIIEIEKAMALFMFDRMDEITEESLKQQRNALIKAFHPDNNEFNETYSQKINAAYELLHDLIQSQNKV